MRPEDIVRLWQRRGIKISSPVASPVQEEKQSSVISEEQRVLMAVFAVDPLTNKPMNDLVLTSNTRLDPTIREFIKQNLQAPVPPEQASNDYGISDELCRRYDETVFEYQQRLRSMAVDGVDYIKTANKKMKSVASKKTEEK